MHAHFGTNIHDLRHGSTYTKKLVHPGILFDESMLFTKHKLDLNEFWFMLAPALTWMRSWLRCMPVSSDLTWFWICSSVNASMRDVQSSGASIFPAAVRA